MEEPPTKRAKSDNTLDFPSPIVKLTVREFQGGEDANKVRVAEHEIHECALVQLPYFETLFSKRWTASQDDGKPKKVSLELPPLSILEDFAMIVPLLYSGLMVRSTISTDVHRLIGLYSLCTMLQSDQLANQLLSILQKITSTDKDKLDQAIANLQQYSTLDEISKSLAKMLHAIDYSTFENIVKGCHEVHHYKFLGMALSSIASYGCVEEYVTCILKYITHIPPDLPNYLDVPVIFDRQCLDPSSGTFYWMLEISGGRRLQVNDRFRHLWGNAQPYITTKATVLEAARVFQFLRTQEVLVPSECCSTWCTLIHKDRANSLPEALHELIRNSVRFTKKRILSVSDFIEVFDCASLKIDGTDHSTCTKDLCRHMYNQPLESGFALDDEAIANILALLNDELGVEAIPVAKHLLNSNLWGVNSLGPLTLAKLQEILFP